MSTERQLRPVLIVVALAGALTARAQAPAADAAAAPVEPPKPKWESSATVGLTLTSGNSETILATVGAKTSRKWTNDELSLGAMGAYGETKVDGSERTKNADTVRGYIQYNRLFNERLFAYGRVEALYDDVADIQYRVALSPGLGYYFIKNPKTELSGEVGPGYVLEKVGGQNDDYVTLRIADKFRHELTDRARIWQSAEFLPQVDDFNNYIVNAEIGLEADLTAAKNLSLRTYLQDTYDNQPAPDRKKNDLKFVTAIAYKF